MTSRLAQAQPKHLPKGERVNKGKPDEKVCYTFKAFKTLLILDSDFTGCTKTQAKLKAKANEQSAVIKALERIAKLQGDNTKRLQTGYDRMFKLWAAENKKRHQAENKPNLSATLGWTAAGALAVATAVLFTVVVVK